MESKKTIPSCLKHWAETKPEKEVFVFFDERGKTTVLTATKVYGMAATFAVRLRDMGFQKGDVIGNALKNCPERVVTDLGILMAGCVVSNLQALEKDGSDLWDIVQCHNCTALIIPAHESNQVYSVIRTNLPPNHKTSSSLDATLPNAPFVKKIFIITRAEGDTNNGQSFLGSLLKDSSKSFSNPEILPTDLAYIFPTSGTSGMSKSVPRTHEGILRIASVFEKMPATKRYCQNQLGWVGGFPFNFLGNCSCNLIQDCFNGKTIIGVDQLWALIEEEKCMTAFMFPPEAERFIGYFEQNGSPKFKLKAMITGGQPLSKRLVSGILKHLSEGVAISYASTEMWAITNHVIRSSEEMKDYMAGVPWAGVIVRIVDDKLQDLTPGQRGDILVKSPFGVYQYFNQPTSRPLCTEDGFYMTGDRGWLDQDGVLYVTDRSDDVIINSIVSVFPSWPESMLAKVPGVSEAVVIGVPQADGLLSDVCACVVLELGSEITKESLVSSYNQRFTTDISDAFLPQLDYVEFFDRFPRTVTGKVKRKELRQMVLERMGIRSV